jgi:WD40 repeat protein
VLRATNPNLAAQLALASYRLAPTKQTRTSLLNAIDAPYRTQFASAVGPARSVVLSPDGHTIAITGEKGIWLSDLADHRDLPRLAVIPSNGYPMAAFGPDGHILVISTSALNIRGSVFTTQLWDVTDPHHPHELSTIPTGRSDVINSVAFDPDGRILATAQCTVPDGRGVRTRTCSVWLWDITDVRHPRALLLLAAYHASCDSLIISPAGHTLIATCEGEPLRRWDLTDARHPHQLAPLTTSPAFASAISPDGRTVAVATSGLTFRLLDLTDPGHPRQLPPPSGDIDMIRSLMFSPDGRTLASTSNEDTIQLWDRTDPHGAHLIATLPERAGDVGSVAFSSDGQALITTLVSQAGPGQQGVIERIDLPLVGYDPALVATVTFSPDGHTIATTSPDGPPQLWAYTPGHLRHRATLSQGATAGRFFAFSGNVAFSRVALGGHAAFSPDRRTLATMKQGVRLWDLTNPRQPRELPAPATQDPDAVAFSPDGRTLAIASRGGRTGDGAEYTIRLWDATKPYRGQNPPFLQQRNNGEPPTLAFSPDGRILATADAIQVGPIWDITDRYHPRQLAPIPTLNANRTTRWTRAMAFSPDGVVRR